MRRLLTVVDYPGLAGRRLDQGVPTGAKCAAPYPGGPVDPSCACQATSDGHVVCSDGFVYSGGCPHCPPINVDGVAPDIAPGIPKIPAARSGSTIPGGAVSAPGSTQAAPGPSAGATALVLGGVLAAGAAAIFFFK